MARAALLAHREGVIAKPSSFDPLSLSPALWFKADAITGKNDGDTVTSWTDQSGNGRNAIQGSNTAVVYKTAILNGLPVARFAGSTVGLFYDAGSGNSFLTGSSLSAFAVFRPTGAGGGSDTRVLSAGSTASTVDFSGTDRAILFETSNGNGAGPYTVTAYFGSGAHNASSQVALNASRQSSIVFNGSTASMYQDGTLDPAAWAAVSSFALRGVGVGKSFSTALAGTGGEAFKGDIGEILLYPSALSTSDRQAVEAYLKAKWGTP